MALLDLPGNQVDNFIDGALVEAKDLQYMTVRLRDDPGNIVQAIFPKSGFPKSWPPNLESHGDDTVDVTFGTYFAQNTGILDIDPDTYPEIYKNLPFPNQNGTTYYVHLDTFMTLRGVRVSPYSGKPYFSHVLDTIGESLQVLGISWDGNELVFEIEDAPGNGTLALAGRKVRVIAMNYGDADSNGVPRPFSSVEEVAIQDLVVESDNQHCRTTVPFGQDNPSTDPNDYMVVLLGPVISDAQEDWGALVGTVAGNGPGATPTTFDTSGHRLYDLDQLWADYGINY